MAAGTAELVATPEEIFRRIRALGDREEQSAERDDAIFRLGVLLAMTPGTNVRDALVIATVMRDVMAEAGGAIMDGGTLSPEAVSALRFGLAFSINLVQTLESASGTSATAEASTRSVH